MDVVALRRGLGQLHTWPTDRCCCIEQGVQQVIEGVIRINYTQMTLTICFVNISFVIVHISVFRMFRSVEYAQKAMDALTQTDDIQGTLTLIGYSGKALWLLVDHMIWLGKTKIYNVRISLFIPQ